jgi:hypothetical protein
MLHPLLDLGEWPPLESAMGAKASRMPSRCFWKGINDLASESMAEGVEGGTLFAFGGLGTGGKLSVFAAGGKLGCGFSLTPLDGRG